MGRRLITMQRYVETSGAVTLVSLFALGLACTRGEVNLGEGATSRNLELSSRCAESTTLPESIYVANQAELDALTGCEEIQELRIVPFADIDLTPLASLRRVTDAFELGAFPENLPEDPEEQRTLLKPIRALI